MVTILTLLGGFVGGGSILVFIQFLISRKDNKDEKNDELRKMVEDNSAEMKKLFEENREQMRKLEEKMDKREALHTRTNILRFNDELIAGHKHSHEVFADILDQVRIYHEYCEDHPHFPNGRTLQATENIKHVYEQLFDKHAFSEGLPKP